MIGLGSDKIKKGKVKVIFNIHDIIFVQLTSNFAQEDSSLHLCSSENTFASNRLQLPRAARRHPRQCLLLESLWRCSRRQFSPAAAPSSWKTSSTLCSSSSSLPSPSSALLCSWEWSALGSPCSSCWPPWWRTRCWTTWWSSLPSSTSPCRWPQSCPSSP